MTLRRFDSTKTRVAPVLEALPGTGEDWLQRLLALPRHGHPAAQPDAHITLHLHERFWGSTEQGLAPPVSLLSWLIRNLSVEPPESDTSAAAAERRLLRAGDPDAIQRALTLLRCCHSSRGWHILEGYTYPDALIMGTDAIVVIEGKRTEAGPTVGTTWMPGRHQMLRHIDAVWELRGRRPVYGFFIVEAQPGTAEIPAQWITAASRTVSEEALRASLPHRSREEQEGIARSFLGVTTWQAVCGAFGLPAELLPHELVSEAEDGGSPANPLPRSLLDAHAR